MPKMPDFKKQLKAAWKKWGPYLSERQWRTVREDYTMATLSKSNVLQDLGR